MSTSESGTREFTAPLPADDSAGAQAWKHVSASMASLPDPAAISKLAMEFLAALPNAQIPPDSVKGLAPATLSTARDLPPSVPVTPPAGSGQPATVQPQFQELSQAPTGARAASPSGGSFYFLEALRPAPTAEVGELPGAASAPANAEMGPAPGADGPAPPNNPVGATGLPAQIADHFPVTVGAGSSFYFLDEERAAPASVESAALPSLELFTLPGLPLSESAPPAPVSTPVPPLGPPTGTAGGDKISPPGTPGAPADSESVQQAAVPAPSESMETPAFPGVTEAQLRDLPGEFSEKALFHQTDDAAGTNYFLQGIKLAQPRQVPLPPASELFSLSGLPGMQSAPGIPVVPSSPTEVAPPETDLRAPANRQASVRVPTVEAGSIAAPPATPSAPPYFYNQEKPVRPTTLPTSDFELQAGMIPRLELAPSPFDARLIRRDFPILQEQVHGRPLVWLDNAATTQKPNAVIDRVAYFYRNENSNIHRAAHTLAARATDAYESAREKTRRFLNASSTREIVFVRGATEGINLVAKSWGHRNVEKDDEIVITWLEHHANIVPWQQLCAEKGARLRVAPVNDRGELILEEYEKLLNPRTRLVAFSHVSNALGTITPAATIIEIAHRHGALVLLDGAQSVSHMRENVQALDCDFFVFSGHKIFAPTGIGVVYGKAGLLDASPPWQGGGNMIRDVTFEKTTYQQAPARFEAGTGNIADAVGLGAALDYLDQAGLENVSRYEHELLEYATAGLATVPGLHMIGTARAKAGVLSFVLDGFRTEDVGKALDQEGIAVRAGHHCAQPILRRMGVESTVRASLAFYNTCEDIDALVAALLRIQAGRGHRGV